MNEDDDCYFLSSEVKLNKGLFSGGTTFETTARPVEHFVDELNEFYKSLNEIARCFYWALKEDGNSSITIG